MKDQPTIIIDHREHANELKDCLQEQYAFIVSVEHLTVGDYSFGVNTIVERKTTRDFCLSIIDGRLFKQAWRLANHRGISLIIVEGLSYMTDHELDIGINAVKGALITLAQTFRLPLLRTRNQQDSAWHLHQLYLQHQHIGEGTQSLHGYTPKTLNSRKSHLLRALPGIGPKMAKSLLDEFGSITNIVTAPESELLKIHGLGPKTVKQIQDVLREPSPFYGLRGTVD